MDEIHHAAIAGKLSLVQALIEEDEDMVDLEDIHAMTPLMLTSSAAVGSYLLSHGANVNQTTNDGCSALYYACRRANPELVQVLLVHGADPNLSSRFGSTPLMMTCSQADEKEKRGQVVKHLLSYLLLPISSSEEEESNARYSQYLDVRNRNGKTALYMAIEQGLEEATYQLLCAGANPLLCTDDDGAGAVGGAGMVDFMLQEALRYPEAVVRLLHKARHLRDDVHAIQEAEEEEDDEEEGNDEEDRRRRRMLKVTPAYLRSRVEQGLVLPHVEVFGGGGGGGDGGQQQHAADDEEEDNEDDLMRDVGEFVLSGNLPKELFIELMEMIIPRWDSCRHV